MKIKLSQEELWTLIDCLGTRGNELNQEFAQTQNYFRRNSEATEEYANKCIELTTELIDIAETQIKLLKRLPQDDYAKKSTQSAEKNLAIYQQAYKCFVDADVRIEAILLNHD